MAVKFTFSGLLLAILASGIVWMASQVKLPSLYDPETAQIHHTDLVGEIGNPAAPDARIGQTVYFRHRNFNGVTLWLSTVDTAEDQPSYIHFSLYSSLVDEKALYRATYQLPSSRFDGPFRITFPAVQQNYEAFYIELSGSNGPIQLKGRLEGPYSQGASFINGEISEADLAFSTTYLFDGQEFVQDIIAIVRNFSLIALIFSVLLLPGWLVVNGSGIHKSLDFWEVAGLSSGISLAIIPLLVLWSNFLGLKWTKIGAILFYGLVLSLSIWFLFNNWIRSSRIKISPSKSSLALLAILILSGILRVSMIRDYVAPFWVDSVHHGLITRLIQEQGSIFLEYQPYFDIPVTSYHLGFHASLAVLQWLSGIALSKIMLVFGQVINLLAVLATYVFAKSLSQKASVGVWAALAAGLLLPVPAYLTSWGRYTHLTGVIIFMACSAIVLYQANSNSMRRDRPNGINDLAKPRTPRYTVVAGVCFAGLVLVHYRVAAFLGIWLIVWMLPKLVKSKNTWGLIKTILLTVITGLVLSAPWLIQALLETVIPRLSPAMAEKPVLFSDFDASILTSAYGAWVIGISLAGLGLGFLKNKRTAIAISIWTFALCLLANANALGLPGGNLVNNVSVEITLFPILGYLFGTMINQLDNLALRVIGPPFNKAWQGMVFLFAGILALSGAVKMVTIINPNTALARQADLAAMTWISKNISSNEEIFISPFTWGYGLCAGYDGGYFISSFTRNKTYPSPILYGMGSKEQVRINQEACEVVYNQNLTPSRLWTFLATKDIEYLYSGARGGKFSPSLIADLSLFEVVYSQDGVWIAKRR